MNESKKKEVIGPNPDLHKRHKRHWPTPKNIERLNLEVLRQRLKGAFKSIEKKLEGIKEEINECEQDLNTCNWALSVY